MQYYYSEHECSICLVKGYSMTLVLMSPSCPAFFYFVKKDDMHAEVSQVCQVFDTDATQL